MLGFVFLIAGILAGVVIVEKMAPNMPAMVRLAGGLVIGIVGNAWIAYIVALSLSSVTDESLTIGLLAALAVNGAVVGLYARLLRPSRYRFTPFEVLFIGLSLAFSFWLLDNRLATYDGSLMVSAETWGDTALHTALSRSFAEGSNYPTEYPFFANEPIRYHFGYDFYAGALQKGGMSVLLSFNLPGALGFTAMMLVLFSIAKMLFYQGEKVKHWWLSRANWVGLVAVSVLITNQSLEWYRWFQRTGSVWEGLKPVNWWNHPSDRFPGTNYLSIGPYYPDKIAIFNTLNVYLTQTHLIIGMAIVLFVAFGLLQPLRSGAPLDRNRMLLLGVLFGLSFWLNGVLFIAAGVFFGTLLVIYAAMAAWRHAEKSDASERTAQFAGEFIRWAKMGAWFIVPALALAIPQSIWLNGGTLSNDGAFRMHYGYLVCSSPNAHCHGIDGTGNAEMDLLNVSDWLEFVEYWALNEGVVFPLLGVALLIGSRSDRKILAAVMAVFVFGSLFQLSRDLGGHNHKVFNLWEVLAAPFIGYAVVELWNIGKDRFGTIELRMRTLQPFAWMLVPVVFTFLVLSGIINFMTVKNDFKVPVFGDRQPAVTWIEDNTDSDSVFLVEPGNLYTSPTLAGRGVYLGYDPWAGSAGYDVNARIPVIQSIYGAPSKDEACRILAANDIDYVLIGPEERSSDRFALNEGTFSGGFVKAAALNQSGQPVDIYDVAGSCDAQAAVAAR